LAIYDEVKILLYLFGNLLRSKDITLFIWQFI